MIVLSDERDLEQIGRLLRAMRRRRGLTQRKLALLMGYQNPDNGEPTLARYENGRLMYGVPIQTLVHLADLMDFDIVISFRDRLDA